MPLRDPNNLGMAGSRPEPRFGVLLVGNFLSAAKPGSCTVCELLAGRLSSAGWSVLTTSDRPARAFRLINMLVTAWRRRSEYAVAQIDVYSGASFFWAEAVCELLGYLGKPSVLTLHGGNLPVFARRWPGRVRRLLNSASFVTTPSLYLQQALHTFRKDLQHLPNAIDLTCYPFRPRSKPLPKLVWLRAFDRIYNPILVPRMVAELAPHLPEIQMTMFGPDKGDGSYLECAREIARLKLGEHIKLAGPIPKSEVPQALDQGDIFINTTNIDNSPVSVIEAMACGICVVSTNAGGLPYLVADGKDGLLVPCGDHKALAASVRQVLAEPALADSISRNARAKAEHYDWGEILPLWEALLVRAAYTRTPHLS